MKFYNINLVNAILRCMATLLVVGCSVVSASPAVYNATYTPGTIATVSKLLPFDGKVAYIYSTSELGYYYHIQVVAAEGSGLKDITPENLPLINSLALSSDGKYIAFAASVNGKDQIFTMKVDGSDLKQLTFREENSYGPSWSPNGEYIIFSSFQKDIEDYRGALAQQVYIMDSDGNGMRRLIDNNESMSAVYRNDGLISISVSITRQYLKTYVVNSDGVIQKQFPELTTESPIFWSPDSKSFALVDISRTDCSGIIIFKSDGSNHACLTIEKIPPSATIYRISWSPDGKYLIFSSNLDGDYDLYAVKPDGSGLTQLTNLPGDELNPVCSSGP